MESTMITSDRSVSERRFYTGMAIAILLSVLLGFARSFFLKPLFPNHPAPAEPVFYIHGAVFTLWIVLFVVQVAMIAQGKVELHRKLGPVGGVIVVAMVILGIFGALMSAARPTGFIGIPIPGLQFLAIPIFDMVVFPAFVILAFVKRHHAQSHKRWMLLATLNLITAAIARWPIIGTFGPLAYFGITDLFIIALAIWDFRSRGRLHTVTVWGGGIMIISQPLRLVVSGTSGWQSFAAWATDLVR
jgi:hypothetical protein